MSRPRKKVDGVSARSKLTDLHPFVSVLIAEQIPSGNGAKIVEEIVETLTGRFNSDEAISVLRKAASAEEFGEFYVGWITYCESVRPAWTSSNEFADKINHLFLVCVRREKVALYASNSSVVRFLQRAIGAANGGALGKLSKISAPRLNAAFVKDKTLTLWLSGLHRRTETKVDNKVITGGDLRYALDPLGDQTYFFTAARSRTRLSLIEESVGVAPRKSSVWVGPSSDWSGFILKVQQLFEAIPPAAQGVFAPLPCLAVGIDPQKELKNVRDAFDAAIVPADLLERDLEEEFRGKLQVWRDVRLELVRADGSDFIARVQWPTANGWVSAGDCSVALRGLRDGVELEAELKEEPGASAEVRKSANELIAEINKHPTLLKVWYDTGHVFSGDALHQMQHREFEFEGFEWRAFDNYKVAQEKPVPLSTANIGKQKSLFCWFVNNWQQNLGRNGHEWLACTDGSMEIADFVHLRASNGVPEVTLVHVKGAGSDKASRGISVSSYEVVVSQAVKNLRHLDQAILAGRLAEVVDARLKDSVWQDGKLASRDDMLKAVRKAGTRFRRHVVILQPHARKSALSKAWSDGGREFVRAAQLHTLLLGAQSNCHNLGASFRVITEET